MNYDNTIAPGQTWAFNCKGDYFAVVFAPVDLIIRTFGSKAGGDPDLYSQGDSMELPPGDSFTRVEVKNPSATATATVLIYAGFGRYVQRRQAVVEPPTEFVGWAPGTLAATTGVTFTGLPAGNLFRRKCIQISNEDPNLDIYIRDSSNRVGLTVYARTSVTLPISQSVNVYNFNGVAVSVRISEIWWST